MNQHNDPAKRSKAKSIALIIVLIFGAISFFKTFGIIGDNDYQTDEENSAVQEYDYDEASASDGASDTENSAAQEYDYDEAEASDYDEASASDGASNAENDSGQIDEDGKYTTAGDVAEYIHTYHKLPSNYVHIKEAYDYGWSSDECPADYGIMIGGMRFGNREKLLPKGNYYECDVDYDGYLRGTRRLVYTKDGTVYYTADHYESFSQLY